MLYIEQENLIELFSKNRLKSYKFDINDDNPILLERYLLNIEISKAFYPLVLILYICISSA